MGLKGYFWGLEYIVYIGSAEKLIPSTRDQFDRKASRVPIAIGINIKELFSPSRVLGIGDYL